MSGFKREVALLALPVFTFIGVALTHLLKLDAQTSAWVQAVFVATGTAIGAALTTPRALTIISGAVVTAFTLVAQNWWHLDPSVISAAIIVIQLIVAHQIRPQVTALIAPAPAPAEQA